jgi:hypothetical protein
MKIEFVSTPSKVVFTLEEVFSFGETFKDVLQQLGPY